MSGIHANGEWLEVDSHRLRFSEHGNPHAQPVLVIHGGPGSGTRGEALAPLDLSRCRVIAYDQRGAGQSRPGGELQHNTTQLLVEDMERLREHCGIERWLLFAGSWGATLALLYAQRFEHRVAGLVLRGTFLARRADIEWFFGPRGVARDFAQAYAAFSSLAGPVADGAALASAYAARLNDPDPAIVRDAAAAWLSWDRLIGTGKHNGEPAPSETQINAVRIAAHYAAHDFFLNGEGVPLTFESPPRMPLALVHGKHDRMCRPEASETLHVAWPGSILTPVDGGHLASDPPIEAALRAALDAMLAASPHIARRRLPSSDV